MLLNTYVALRKELTAEGAFTPNNIFGLMTVVSECAVFAACAAGVGLSRPFSLLFWVCEVLAAVSAYRMFVILHECGHGSLFARKWMNTAAGLLASPVCLLPYWPWRSVHAAHHQWVGVVDKDPTQAHILKLRGLPWYQKILLRVFWKTWIPAPFIKFIIEIFWLYPFRETAKGNRSEALLGFASLAACFGPHALLIGWLGFGHYLTVVLPGLVIFYVIFEMINLPQHSGHFPFLSSFHPRPVPFREQDAITRTTYLPRLFAVLLCYNFNLHTEHHLFPTVPWYRLPRVTAKIKGLKECHYEEVEFLRFMADLRAQDPLDVYEKTLPTTEPNHAADLAQAHG
jgi:fatty acid desaturase